MKGRDFGLNNIAWQVACVRPNRKTKRGKPKN